MRFRMTYNIQRFGPSLFVFEVGSEAISSINSEDLLLFHP
jgi:hypothetical protein